MLNDKKHHSRVTIVQLKNCLVVNHVSRHKNHVVPQGVARNCTIILAPQTIAQRWKYGVDRWTSSADELSTEVIALADLASEFWLDARDKTNTSSMDLKELRLRGGLYRLDALKLPLEEWCRKAELVGLLEAYGEFVDAVSGGKFDAKKRLADPARALEIQAVAADLVSSVRGVLRHGVTWKAAIKRLVATPFKRNT